MKLLCRCGKEFYFQNVIDFVSKQKQIAAPAYCDCGAVIHTKITPYIDEISFRYLRKYNGRAIIPSKLLGDKFDIKIVCCCASVVVFDGCHHITENKSIFYKCRCRKIYSIDFLLYNNIDEFKNRNVKKLWLGPKPSLITLSGKGEKYAF